MCKLISNAGLCCFGIESTTADTTTADLFSSSTQACDTRVASKQVVGTVTGSNITHLFLGLGESATYLCLAVGASPQRVLLLIALMGPGNCD